MRGERSWAGEGGERWGGVAGMNQDTIVTDDNDLYPIGRQRQTDR